MLSLSRMPQTVLNEQKSATEMLEDCEVPIITIMNKFNPDEIFIIDVPPVLDHKNIEKEKRSTDFNQKMHAYANDDAKFSIISVTQRG